jgi:NitT/TauT family transport system ATP-binding protein
MSATTLPLPPALPAVQNTLRTAARGQLRLEGVSHAIGGQTILDQISLDIRPGEFVVVVGPSGSGKSTLLNIAGGMVKPSAGQVLLDGKRLTDPGPDRTMVFQDHGLFPWLTAEQNVAFGLNMARVDKAEVAERTRQALAAVHLETAAGKLVHELSGGMRQRVAIARALVLDPAVLLMDEPFAALDAQTRTLLHVQLQDLWLATRKTVLFVTHSVGEAVRLADRIIVLHASPGRVRQEFVVNIPHPRDFDTSEVTELVREVRFEIDQEVNRLRREQGVEVDPVTGHFYLAEGI